MTLTKRPPVVVVMGHIDHGKSTLLDTIRHSNVVATEAGGITQHLSAYTIEHDSVEHGTRSITFLDTPGHASFQKMRLRGADVADIAILIVSAEDAVMPQTLEALTAIKEADIPYVVAINKIDKPNADIIRTQSSLIEHEIFIEGLGGDIPWVAISAKAGTGIPELLDTIILVAELADITGDPTAPASGTVIEGHLDKKRGIAATIIIKNGTVESGSFLVSEHAYTPVRIMENSSRIPVRRAGLSEPVEIIGWSDVPRAGADFISVKNKKEAEVAVTTFTEKKKSLTQIVQKIRNIGSKLLIPVVVKADTLGSLEAIATEIEKLKNDRIELKVVSETIGDISTTDIQNANATEHAIVIGFHNKLERAAEELAERLDVATATFTIIYNLADWLKEMINARIPRKEEELKTGTVKILKLFSTQKHTHLLGGKIVDGSITRGQRVHVMRRDLQLGVGVVDSLQQSKSSVETISDGEFGMQITTRVEVSEGDLLVPYTMIVT